jgi:DHA3 family macrolide efflux protein-like MFS transporter
MSAWGGFKRRAHGVLGGWIWSGLAMAVLGLTGGIPVWLAGSALGALIGPLINGSNQAIWQSKVAPDVQGRVFSARRLIAWLTNPISPIIAGVLADYLLEPTARAGTGLPAMFSWMVGTGPGSGMGLLLVICGLASALVGLAGYFIPAIYHAETILPDHDQLKPAEAAA